MNEFARPGLAEEKLPPVSTADNDKVLTVDGGVWKAKTPSGGGGGVLVVNVNDGALDKTWQEIHDAMLSGGAVYSRNVGVTAFVFAGMGGTRYHVDTAMGDEFYTSTADGYPQMNDK